MIAFLNIFFCKDESGAVTVDWVILTGVVMAVAMAVLVFIPNIVETGLIIVTERIVATN